MFLFFIKAYSSVVERSAHNGFVVGSNPAGPILVFFKKLTIKLYKVHGFQFKKLPNF